MRSQINKKILLYLFLFILLGTLNNKNINNFQFIDIKEIKVEGLSEDNNLRLLKNLDFLKFQNIFFINKKKSKNNNFKQPCIKLFCYQAIPFIIDCKNFTN